MAQECLFEAERTLDPETSATLRKLAERFFVTTQVVLDSSRKAQGFGEV
jgi:hypothetical protein